MDSPKVTVICGVCEKEWDADKRSATAPCPRPSCGFHDAEGEENIIRIDESAPEPRASRMPPHLPSLDPRFLDALRESVPEDARREKEDL